MKEIISLHIGSAGVNIGDACIQQFCQETGIQKNACLREDINLENNLYQIFFRENEAG